MIGKLVLHPLAVFGALALLPPLPADLRTCAVLFAAMPMLSVYPVLAQRYGQEKLCAAVLLAATASSFVTITLLLWFLRSVLGWHAQPPVMKTRGFRPRVSSSGESDYGVSVRIPPRLPLNEQKSSRPV